MALLSVLCGATKSAPRLASAGSSVMPLPAPVALYNLCLSNQRLSVGNHPE
ncbi:hypothetical protein PENSUB_4174 [Penicillium subrubescens]|uniref:Uncharacterized protein n=1 Tax=Penicillium subrubescens TaxID=1316194 RepID=A0A1Q5UD34_9EURO|nr:hypothetical protein PENSUB_4174 [Penicillium subrubescens]